ncbi:HEAT domain-containing protein [Oryctes borbonicus]|uniref:HEAT domain-containing protein n=1 Tax=Oryctes borbonicus TaxID=1629725 RepID=A0A0T6B5B1_9SCAR|nr:HEAT domain-containing protein [Oryctes borbonicus]
MIVPVKQISKEELLICIPHLYANLEDRNAEVRKNAQEAVLGIMIHLSYESMVKQTEKLKPGSKTVVMAALDKARPNLPLKPLPSKKQAPEKDAKAVRGTKPVANSKNAVKSKGTAPAKQPVSSRKKDDDIDTSPLLVINNMKHQRTIDESKLKVLKWNFTTPREEFVELLKEQMANANVNKTLMNNMFHTDFRYHIKAIESLMDDLPDNSTALISNLDLILKWLTLRFFDTNPSVLLKGLEYLHSVFNMLIEHKYHILENEASSFIPYLILKIGDPKDAVRNGVRSLFKQICDVYAVSKLFSYIMEGLKSKNARQRAECLEVMGSIIEDYGITVCLPSPTACLKEVAKQISDRDNAVRNAALNCVVQAYYIVGEKVYKMVGQISDKDMSLLEERIKRAAKKPPPQKTKIEPISVPLNSSGSPQRFSSAESSPAKSNALPDNDLEEDIEQEVDVDDDIPQVALPPVIQETQKGESAGVFSLDPEFMKELDNLQGITQNLQLQKFDLEFLKEEIVVPPIADSKAKIMPLSPPKPINPSQMFSRTSLGHKQLSPRLTQQDVVIERTISQISNSDIPTALSAIEQMQEILQSQKGNLLVNFEDLFMTSVSQQFKQLSYQPVDSNPQTLKTYRALLTVIDCFYNNKVLGRKISVDVLKEIMLQLISILAEGKLSDVVNGDSYVRVVNLHCVKIMERSDHTNIICTLVKLLHYCISASQQPRFVDLVMKCLWRVIKIMPNWTDEIDYDSVLLEIHIFFKDFPNSWWKTRESDTPVRTIKTIVHSMVKMKGAGLMMHLGKIPNTNDSEMEAYILRLLKGLKMEGAMKVPLKTDTRRSLSRSTHTQLTNIFQKIGNKDETDEGLNMLYDFLQQHPEADIDPFLKRSSQFFQDYIQKNLSKIDSDRKSSTPGRNEELENKLDSVTSDNSSSTGSRNLEYWKQRLEMWNRIWDETINKQY